MAWGWSNFCIVWKPPPAPWRTRVTSHGPPAGCDTDVPRGAGAHIQPGSTPQRCIYSKTPPPLPPLILPPTPPPPPHNTMSTMNLARRMFKIGAPILRYPPRRGVNPGGICAPRARGTPVSHPAGGPRGVTRVCRGVGVVEFLQCMNPPLTPWHTRVTFHGPPAGCDTDVPRDAGAHI